MTVRSINDAPKRPTISVDARLITIADSAIRAIAKLDVYQRGGQLVDVVHDAKSNDGIARPEGTPRIRILPSARLRELLEVAADFTKDTDKGVRKVRPPRDVVETVGARGEWHHVRPLSGIVNWPIVRPDGTLLTAPGYDAATGMICACDVDVQVPVRPTRIEAETALGELLDVVCDFPFGTDAHRASWLATLLGVLARPAIDGPTPMTLLNASERGAGKTLLADVVGMITSGRMLPRRTAPAQKEEWDKAMLAIAIAGDPIILIDNVTTLLKSDALDAVLTGTEFRGRILGRNEELSLPVRTIFITTANNATLSADLVRRSLESRLEPQVERPEMRADFKHADLLGYCRENRARLLCAALTVLRGYVVAGRSEVKLRPMGSYEAWSKVVRAPLVWLGMADPAETQDALRENADTEHEAVRDVLVAWYDTLGDRAFTAKEVLYRLADDSLSGRERTLRDALAGLCETDGRLPSARKLGNSLRVLRGRISGDLIMWRPSGHTKEGVTWQVRRLASRGAAGDSGDSGDSVPTRTHGESDENGYSQDKSHHIRTVTEDQEPGLFEEFVR